MEYYTQFLDMKGTFLVIELEDVHLCTDTGASEVAHYVDVQLRLVPCYSEPNCLYLIKAIFYVTMLRT